MKHAFCLLALGMGTLTLTACGGGDNSTHHTTPVAHTHETAPSTTPNHSANTTPSNSNTTTTPSATNNKLQGSYPIFKADGIKRETHASSLSNVKITDNGQTIGTELDFATLPQGLSTHNLQTNLDANTGGQTTKVLINEKLRIYKQPNSVIIGSQFAGATVGSHHESGDDNVTWDYLGGNSTKTLPTAGTFNYVGKAFNENSEGSFEYAIDFGTKTGQGKIAVNGKNLTLEKSTLGQKVIKADPKDHSELSYEGFGIQGTVSGDSQGIYKLGVFGDNAEEVAGYTHTGVGNFGFGGAKK